MYRILIVEDTPSEADVLRAHLSRYAAERGLTFQVKVLDSALEFINSRHVPDLVFMDIDMPGINGMEAAQIMRGYDPATPLVFVTNLAQYAIRGYQVDALDFMLKPVRYGDFAIRMDRAMNVVARQAARTMALPTEDGVRVVPLGDITHIDLRGHDVQYHLASGQTLCERGTLKAVAEKFDACDFVRISSGCLVNMGRAASVSSAGVVLDDGTELFFSRGQRKQALETLANFMGRSI